MDSEEPATTRRIDGTETRPRRPVADVARGTRFGRYVVEELVGTGGMAAVYCARDPDLDRRVALKLVRMSGPVARSHGARQRAIREAQAMAQLSHPNVLPVFDVGHVGGDIYLAMELVQGSTLREWLARRRHTVTESVQVFAAAGRGLAAAHAVGLVHRDFKPDNVLVGDDGRVRVMDFGLVRAVADISATGEASALTGSSASHDDNLTQTNVVMGTPAYMAPEQIRGREIGPAADQFAFCVALHEALFGIRPFRGRTLAEIAESIERGSRNIAKREGVPRSLGRLIDRGLSRQAGDRYASMDALVERLERSVGTRRRAGMTLAGTVVVSGVVWAALELGPHEGCDAIVPSTWVGHRTAVRDQFEGLELDFATDVVDRIEARLDRYADEWIDARVSACEAVHRGDGAARARVVCLEERRVELDVLVTSLSEANATVAQKSVQAVDALVPVSSCLHPRHSSVAAPPPAVVDDVARLRKELAAIRARERIGDYAQALQDATAMEPEVRALGYQPLLAEVLYRIGLLRRSMGDPTAAEQPLTEAVRVAQLAGHAELAVEAMSDLVWLLGDPLQRPDEALEWARHAEAALARLGDPPLLRADYLSSRGLVFDDMGRDVEARADHEEALRLRLEHGDANAQAVAAALTNLGNVALDEEKYDEAIGLYERALARQGDVFGPDHPAVALTLHNIGLARLLQGRPAAAREVLVRALAVREQAYGPVHPRVAATLDTLADVDDAEGDSDRATVRIDRALTIRREVFGDEHPRVAQWALNVGIRHHDAGRLEEARERYEMAARGWEATVGPTDPLVANAVHNLGMVAVAQDKHDDARRFFARAVKIRSAPLHPKLGKSLAALGFVELELGDEDAAVGHLRRATEVWDEGPSPATRAEVRFALAKATRANDPTGARALALRARQDLSMLDGGASSVAAIDAWLAETP